MYVNYDIQYINILGYGASIIFKFNKFPNSNSISILCGYFNMAIARETLTTAELREKKSDSGDGNMMAMNWEHPCPCGEAISVRSEDVAKRGLLDALLDNDEDTDEMISFPQKFQCPQCNFAIEVRFTLNELGSCCFFARHYDRSLEYYKRAHKGGELSEVEFAYNVWEALNEWSRENASRDCCQLARKRFEQSGCDPEQVASLMPTFWFEEEEALARAEAEAKAREEAIALAKAAAAERIELAQQRLGLSPDAARKRSRALLKKLRKISRLREALKNGSKKQSDLNADQIAMMDLEDGIMSELLDIEDAFGVAARAASAAVATEEYAR